jgi:polar amino acid transport system substrate-binding protein
MRTFDAAGKVFAALEEGAWNLAFLAIEPVREAFTAIHHPVLVHQKANGCYTHDRELVIIPSSHLLRLKQVPTKKK